VLLIGACHIATVSLIFHPYYYYQRYQSPPDEGTMITYSALTFGYLALPVFATYFALRVRNLIAAGILTAATTLVAPFFGMMVLMGYDNFIVHQYNVTHTWESACVAILFGNALFGGLAVFLLHHSLSRRIYSF
jgi:hypothetical protein